MVNPSQIYVTQSNSDQTSIKEPPVGPVALLIRTNVTFSYKTKMTHHFHWMLFIQSRLKLFILNCNYELKVSSNRQRFVNEINKEMDLFLFIRVDK